MPGVALAGMGTQLDIYGMATTQAQAKTSAASNRLTAKETDITNEIAALEALDSAMNGFYNTLNKYSSESSFGSLSVDINSDARDFARVTVEDGAVPNSYKLDIQQLATQHKVQAFHGAGDGEVPAGQHTFSVGSESFTIDVKDGQNSLSEVAFQINEASDNTGMTASVISDGTTSYLTLTANETGKDNEIQVDGGDAEQELEEALNARYTIDGVPLTSQDNTIDDVIDGVTIELKDITKDDDGNSEPIKFGIETDTDNIKSSIEALIDSFNGVLKTLDNLSESSFDEKGDVVRKPLSGDSMVSSIEREMKDVLYSEFDDTFSSLASIGVTTDRNGKLELDDDIFDEAIEKDPDAISDMFVGEDGVIDQLQEVAAKYVGRAEDMTDKDGNTIDAEEDDDEGYVKSTGLLDDRLKALREDKRGIEEEWAVMEKRYDDIYQRYLNEYIAMDLAVSQMNSSLNGLL